MARGHGRRPHRPRPARRLLDGLPKERFEAALLRAVPEVLHVDGERAARLGVVFLSLAHMFDSEAVTFAVYPNPALEAARLEWATAVLSDELRALGLS